MTDPQTDRAKCAGGYCTIRSNCARYTKPKTGTWNQTWLLIHASKQGRGCTEFKPISSEPSARAVREVD